MKTKKRIFISLVFIIAFTACSSNKKVTRSSDCDEKNTGSYCFQNNTKYTLNIELKSNPPKLPGINDGFKLYESVLKPGALQCFSDIPVGNANYKIVNVNTNKAIDSTAASRYIVNGVLVIEECKQGRFNIK